MGPSEKPEAGPGVGIAPGVLKSRLLVEEEDVVQIHRLLDEPLRSLVVASAVAVDTALKQDGRGLG